MPTMSNVGVFVSYSETRRILSMLARSSGTLYVFSINSKQNQRGFKLEHNRLIAIATRR